MNGYIPQDKDELIGWLKGKHATPPQEKDELARLREEVAELTRKGEQITHALGVSMMENASMRTAIYIAHLELLYSQSSDLPVVKNHVEFAIKELQPFTESK